MTEAEDAWAVVLIAELVRASDELLLRALRLLDVDARVGMSVGGAWVLSGSEARELCGLLDGHAELAERLRSLVEQLPESGVVAAYRDVRDGAAAALAKGVIDAATVRLAARALDVRHGWAALAQALASTDVRCAWAGLEAGALLGEFRDADDRLVRSVLAEARVEAGACWADLDDDATARLVEKLSAYASCA